MNDVFPIFLCYSFFIGTTQMKYLTKEYLLRKKELNCLQDYESVPNGLSFEELYQEKLTQRLAQAEKLFNTPVEMKEKREDIISNFDEHRYPKFDLVARRCVGYQSLDEVLRAYDYQVAKQKLLFEQRGAFNGGHVKDLFQSQYEENLAKAESDIPYLFRKEIDPRFLALHCIPESSYQRIQKYLFQVKEETEKREKDAKESSLNAISLLPKDFRKFMEEKLPLACILQESADLTFIFHFEGLRKKDSTGLEAFRFLSVDDISTDGVRILSSFDRNHMERRFLKAAEIEKEGDRFHISMILERETMDELSFCFKGLKSHPNF